MEHKEAAINYLHAHKKEFLEELKEFVRIPSVSTDLNAKADMHRAASWVVDRLRKIGVENVNIFPTKGHPVVYGEHLKAGADKPVVLIYGHYDVQPAEPLELWNTPAFEPTQIGENLHGRALQI